MNTSIKTRVASSIAAFALVGTAVPASAAEHAMPDQQMMMQGQAQESGAPGAMPGYGMGMMGYGMGYGYGMGPGMMGGMMNMMGGGCPMMGGGMGPGMGMMGGGMGGYGYGAGMMMGPGMMGGMGAGYGMGPGMRGGMGPMAMLDLSEAQTAQLKKIQTESMKRLHALMLQMWEAQLNLGDLLNAEKRDPAAIGKAYGTLADVQRQALETRIDAGNKTAAVLTKEQMMQMRRGPGSYMMGN